jgi:hypothetical protein
LRLTEGQQVKTPLGWGRVTKIENARDRVAGHGRPIRGLAKVFVQLDSGARVVCTTAELIESPP